MMKTKPQPLDLEEISKDARENLKFNEAKWVEYTLEFVKQRIKLACEFWLKYKDKPELLVKEYPEYEEKIKGIGFGWFPPFLKRYLIPITGEEYRLETWKEYNEWLFKHSFKDVLEEENDKN